MYQQQRRAFIAQELNCSLSEWGVGLTAQPDTKADHERIRKKVVDAGLAMLTETLREPYSVRDLQDQQFPSKIDAAYKYVLSQEDVPLPIFLCTDSLDGHMPYHRCHDRRDQKSKKNREVVWYQRKIEYKGLPLEKLDPFRRFKYESITLEEEIFRRWFLEGDASKDGILMEATVARYAIHTQTCANCKAARTLRWKGGSCASWQDLVCINCMAMYEVKTKESMEEIQGVVDRNHLRGGSFRVACRLENSLLPGQKRYIVFLPRKETSKRMEMVHPVQVVEIESIIPHVSRMVFCDRKRNIEIQRRVILKCNTRKHWFDLPFVKTRQPLDTIRKEVFVQKFSKKTFNRLMAKHNEEEPPSSTQGSAHTKTPNKKPNKVEKMKRELDKEAADDWEDLLSDSDNDSTSN